MLAKLALRSALMMASYVGSLPGRAYREAVSSYGRYRSYRATQAIQALASEILIELGALIRSIERGIEELDDSNLDMAFFQLQTALDILETNERADLRERAADLLASLSALEARLLAEGASSEATSALALVLAPHLATAS